MSSEPFSQTCSCLCARNHEKCSKFGWQDDLQWRFLAQHCLAMSEQCCNCSKLRRNNVVMLCCAKNRRWGSFRVTSLLLTAVTLKTALKPFKGHVTRYDFQRRFLEQHSVAMFEQCCSYSKQCRKSVATLCCAKNGFWESSRVTSP